SHVRQEGPRLSWPSAPPAAPIAVVRAGHHEVLARVALATEAAVLSTDDRSKCAQAVLRRDGSEVEQQVLRSALLLCRRRQDNLTRISVIRPGGPYLLEEGLAGKHFFQKHVETTLPTFVDHACLYAEQHGSSGEHVVCNNLPTLLWLGQVANVELHPW